MTRRGIAIAFVALVALGVVALPSAFGRTNAQPPSTRTLLLFTDGAPSGSERDVMRSDGSDVIETYAIDLRAGPGIRGTTTLRRLASDGRFLALDVDGSTFPWFPSERAWRATASDSVVPIASPFPIGRLHALVRRWERTGRPHAMRSTNGATIEVRECGSDTVRVARVVRALRCVDVRGLTWGTSTLWYDPRNVLAAAFVPTVVGKVQAIVPELRDARDALMRAAAIGGARRLTTELATAVVADARSRTVVLRDVAVLNVTDGTRIDDAAIVLRGDRIVDLGPRSRVAIPVGAQVLSARGGTALHGLRDAHAHVRHAAWGPAYLGVGVTSVRDVGNERRWITSLRDAFAAPGSAGPTIDIAGWIDGEGSAYPSGTAHTAAEARALVRRYHADGASAIKLWVNATPAVASAAIAEAHALGMTTTRHEPDGATLLADVSRGLDHVEHLDALLDVLAKGPDSLHTPAALGRFLRRHHVGVTPTLVVDEYWYHALDRPLDALEPGLRQMPRDMVRANELLRGRAEDRATGDAAFARALALVRALHDAGVPLAAGSDQGVPGFTLLREVELLAMAGLPPIDALRAAVPNDRVAPGATAELVVVDGDPASDVSALRRTRFVIHGGRVLDASAVRRVAGLRP